jgi:sarcosine oxidase subunit gamma
MPEHPGFELRQIHGRSIVHLRVRPDGANSAGAALQLPLHALRWLGDDPVACWLSPDQWLIASDTKSARDISADINRALGDQLHAATDMSSGYACFALKGPAARTLLAMGCGIDMHPGAFSTGQCVRTHFAQVLLLIVAVEDHQFELYLDSSLACYLRDWLAQAGKDPLSRTVYVIHDL